MSKSSKRVDGLVYGTVTRRRSNYYVLHLLVVDKSTGKRFEELVLTLGEPRLRGESRRKATRGLQSRIDKIGKADEDREKDRRKDKDRDDDEDLREGELDEEKLDEDDELERRRARRRRARRRKAGRGFLSGVSSTGSQMPIWPLCNTVTPLRRISSIASPESSGSRLTPRQPSSIT